MKLVNKTPHAINIRTMTGQVLVLPPDPDPIRLEETRERAYILGSDSVAPVEVLHITYGTSQALPPVEQDTYYIVSQLVARAYPQRTDFLTPGPAVRDEQGTIVGCRGLATLWP